MNYCPSSFFDPDFPLKSNRFNQPGVSLRRFLKYWAWEITRLSPECREGWPSKSGATVRLPVVVLATVDPSGACETRMRQRSVADAADQTILVPRAVGHAHHVPIGDGQAAAFAYLQSHSPPWISRSDGVIMVTCSYKRFPILSLNF